MNKPNDTTSTIDACTSVRDLRLARCRQYNDLLDEVVGMVNRQTKVVVAPSGMDDFVNAVHMLEKLIGDGISMAVTFGYFNDKQEEESERH